MARPVKPARDTGIGDKGVTAFWVILFVAFVIAESALLLYAAIAFWPDTSSPAPAEATVQFFGQKIVMTREQNLLLVVAILGGVGAMGHVLRSFVKYVGQRNLIWSWMPQYVLIPILGAILATISYILLRAGLIGTGSGAGQEGNIWGFAAVATLVGLFTAQAAAKLKDVFEIVLAPSPPGSDSLSSGAPAPIAFTPKEGKEGTVVDITGQGLEAVTTVTFSGDAEADATWDPDRKVLSAAVPPNARSGPLKVTLDSGVVTSRVDFTVLP